MVDTCPELFLADGIWNDNDHFSYLHCGGYSDIWTRCGCCCLGLNDASSVAYTVLGPPSTYQIDSGIEMTDPGMLLLAGILSGVYHVDIIGLI